MYGKHFPHFGLVVKIASKYFSSGTDADDLIQAGLLGVLHAEKLFDKKRGFRFSTYAVPWIKNYIHREIQKDQTIRWPTYVHEMVRVRKRNGKAWRSTKQAERVEDWQWLALDKPMTDSGETLQEILSSNEDPMDKKMLLEERRKAIREKISQLPRKERQAVQMLFGIGYARPMTLREAGKTMKLSFQRVQQIQVQAFKRLKSTCFFLAQDVV